MSGALPLSLRIALRELRGGIAGFRIFLLCLGLGVAAIAAVGSLATAFERGLSEEGQALLGGDLEIELTHRAATDEERAWMRENSARQSVAIEMRAMARAEANDRRKLVQLKAVDGDYPLYGRVRLGARAEGVETITQALAQGSEDLWGVAVEPNLLTRLGVDLGDRLRVGTLSVVIRAVIEYEPDSVAGGFRLGPRLMLHEDALAQTGLVTTGSLVEYHYRLALPEGASNQEVFRVIRDAREAFPDSDWQIRNRTNGAPGAANFIRQLSVFLTLVGLTALVVGGVGVGNAVKSYLDRKQAVIATFKCVGAKGSQIFGAYLAQVLILAFVGIVLGLMVGAATPYAVELFFGAIIPVPADYAVYPQPLVLAAIYGVLTALAFAVWPLAVAREVPAARLFRDIIAPTRTWPRAGYVVATGLALVLLAGLAVWFTQNRIFAAFFVLGAIIVFIALRLAAMGIMRLARAAGRPRHPGLRLALSNIHRPGAPTASVVLSLGLGLTLLVTITSIDGNISTQVNERLPENAPSLFVVDIQSGDVSDFDALALSIDGVQEINRVPSLRGRIVRINGVAADEAEVMESGRWALRGDRGVSYAAAPPENSDLVAGEWWPEDYQGPPLISLEDEIAQEFFLEIGDTITINILGRDITAEVANLRRFDWRTVGLNFMFVMTPATLEAAPHTHVATIKTTGAAEEPLTKALTDRFPNITVISVKEAIQSLNSLIADIAFAVRGASSITLIAGILVLAGAMAAGFRRRVYDAVVLKVLGATRGRVLRAFALEYALLGLATAALSALAGTAAAYLVITQVMNAPWTFLPWTVALTVIGGTAATIVLGLAGTYRTLSAKAAPILRAE